MICRRSVGARSPFEALALPLQILGIDTQSGKIGLRLRLLKRRNHGCELHCSTCVGLGEYAEQFESYVVVCFFDALSLRCLSVWLLSQTPAKKE